MFILATRQPQHHQQHPHHQHTETAMVGTEAAVAGARDATHLGPLVCFFFVSFPYYANVYFRSTGTTAMTGTIITASSTPAPIAHRNRDGRNSSSSSRCSRRNTSRATGMFFFFRFLFFITLMFILDPQRLLQWRARQPRHQHQHHQTPRDMSRLEPLVCFFLSFPFLFIILMSILDSFTHIRKMINFLRRLWSSSVEAADKNAEDEDADNSDDSEN